MLAGAPNLHRTVAECTQPYCAPSPAATRALQKYLCDERCVDLVYLAVLEAVVAKCAALIKQNLHRGVLLAVQAGARRLASSLPPASDVGKSLLFLATSAARLAGGDAAAPSDAAAGWDPARARGLAAGDSHSGASSAAGGGSLRGSRSFGAGGGGGGAEGEPGCPGGGAWGYDEDEGEEGEPAEAELIAMGAARPVVGQGPPPWALVPGDPPSPHAAAGAHGGGGGGGSCGGAEEKLEVDWAELVPEYCGSLAPLLRGMYCDEGGALPALDCGNVLGSFLDADPDAALDQMLDIAAARRQQARPRRRPLAADSAPRRPPDMGAGDDVLAEAAVAMPRRAPLHHTPYTRQEPLAGLAPGEVAAVLEVVLGRGGGGGGGGGGGAPSAVTGRRDDGDADAHWAPLPAPPAPEPPAAGRGAASSSGGAAPRESFGAACAAVLAKMVVDTWLAAGGAASLPLALRMLQGALHHDSAAVRARAFDTLYNLSLHAALLNGNDGDDDGGGGDGGGYGAGAAPPQQQFAGGGGGAPPPPPPPEPGGRLYARPQSPSGAQRPRGGSGQRVAQLPSPRIHLPPQVMQQPSPGGSASGSGSAGALSPRSPLALGPGALANGGGGASPPPLSPQLGLASPRSRLARGGGGGGGFGDAPDSPHSSARAAPVAEGGDGAGSDAAVAAAGLAGGGPGALELEFEGWLRALLFELLVMLSQLDERSEAVWQSAAGCMLHLTTCAGYWVRGAAEGLPPQALRGLLRACLTFGWAPELHARLAQLAPLVLRPAAAGGARGGEAEGGDGDGGDGGGGGGGGEAEGGGSGAARLAEFGGAGELMHHFCAAASPEAQRCLLLPLLEHCMRPGTSPAAAARTAAALAGSPARLRALQAALWGGRPGLAEPILSALGAAGQFPNAGELQTACSVVLALEALATGSGGGGGGGGCEEEGGGGSSAGGEASGGAAGERPSGGGGGGEPDKRPAPPAGRASTSSGGAGSRRESRRGSAAHKAAGGGSSGGGEGGPPDASAAAAEAAAPAAAVACAVELTRWHVAGELPEFQAAAAAAAWRALRELCWCGEPAAQAAAARWLQQLLAAALDQSAESAAPLPLPPPAAGAAPPGGPPPGAGMAALAEALGHIVGHCTAGPGLLVDALQLHITAARLWHDAPAGGADADADARAAAADLRAAAGAARAWALVLQWLSRGAPRGAARGPLARLAALAGSLLCYPPPTAGQGGCWDDGGSEAGDACGAGDGVCGPHGFLLGTQLLSQEAVVALGVEPLSALVSRLLPYRPSPSAAARGFTTRLELGGAPPAALPSASPPPPPPPSPLAPASEAGWDAALSLLLFLLAACGGDEHSYAEAGLEALARQAPHTHARARVLASGLDPRQCYYLSAFVLEHLMLHQQGRYWAALKGLLAQAQAAGDERLLGNPFLQLQALFGGG
ncbi:MAG: hypothetical protein J3K34DRAFT_494699 [Monoraphidium minutum]|nr:MAG: hypothetical protein J3K34DRAFT_494699 [Monoraphidium minutum]